MRGSVSWAGCVLVCIGLAMPWASVRMKTTQTRRRSTFFSQNVSAQTVQISGFNSNATFFGLRLPGAFVGVAAFAVVITLARAKENRQLPLFLVIYGIIHVCFMVLALWNTPHMEPQVGLIVSLAGIGMLFMAVWMKPYERRRPIQESTGWAARRRQLPRHGDS